VFAQSENQGSQEGVTDPQEQPNPSSDSAAPEAPSGQEFTPEPPLESPMESGSVPPVDPVAAMDGVAEAAEALKSEFFGGDAALDRLNDVQLDVRVELGRSRMLVDDVLRLGSGSVVELDRPSGDPVDIFVNNGLVARGEVVVLDEKFCVRITEILGRAAEGI
jgi:flagellar motor switch protein FliN